MRTRAAVISLLCLAIGLAAAPAQAQYPVEKASDPAPGEHNPVESTGNP